MYKEEGVFGQGRVAGAHDVAANRERVERRVEARLAMRRDHPLASKPETEARDLMAYAWALPPTNTPLRGYWEAMVREAGGEPPHVGIECGSVLTIRELLLETDMLTLLSPDQLRVEIDAGLLVSRAPPPSFSPALLLVRPPSPAISPAAAYLTRCSIYAHDVADSTPSSMERVRPGLAQWTPADWASNQYAFEWHLARAVRSHASAAQPRRARCTLQHARPGT